MNRLIATAIPGIIEIAFKAIEKAVGSNIGVDIAKVIVKAVKDAFEHREIDYIKIAVEMADEEADRKYGVKDDNSITERETPKAKSISET
jgi:hypothetical protein